VSKNNSKNKKNPCLFQIHSTRGDSLWGGGSAAGKKDGRTVGKHLQSIGRYGVLEKKHSQKSGGRTLPKCPFEVILQTGTFLCRKRQALKERIQRAPGKGIEKVRAKAGRQKACQTGRKKRKGSGKKSHLKEFRNDRKREAIPNARRRVLKR